MVSNFIVVMVSRTAVSSCTMIDSSLWSDPISKSVANGPVIAYQIWPASHEMWRPGVERTFIDQTS